MAHVSRSKASLRIIGDSLNPEEISRIVGCKGSTMYSKGDIKVSKTTGKQYERKSGHWSLRSTECEPEDINGQVAEILGQLTNNLAVWSELNIKYSIDIFCGLFLETSNEGMDISPETLVELGNRGIVLSLDIYGETE